MAEDDGLSRREKELIDMVDRLTGCIGQLNEAVKLQTELLVQVRTRLDELHGALIINEEKKN